MHIPKQEQFIGDTEVILVNLAHGSGLHDLLPKLLLLVAN